MYKLTKTHAYGLGDPSSTLPSARSLIFLQSWLSRFWVEQGLAGAVSHAEAVNALHTKIKYLLVLMVPCVPAPTWVPYSLHCNAPPGAIHVRM